MTSSPFFFLVTMVVVMMTMMYVSRVSSMTMLDGMRNLEAADVSSFDRSRDCELNVAGEEECDTEEPALHVEVVEECVICSFC